MKKEFILILLLLTAINRLHCQENLQDIYDVIKKNQVNSEKKHQEKVKASTGNLENFVYKLKKLNINVDSADEVRALLGKPNHQYKMGGREQWWYIFDAEGGRVSCEIWIDSGKMLTCVRVSKAEIGEVYSKGNYFVPDSSKEPSKSDTLVAPLSPLPNPTPGQIYFNSTDSHFYGWNGNEWLQLDNPKN